MDASSNTPNNQDNPSGLGKFGGPVVLGLSGGCVILFSVLSLINKVVVHDQ